MNKPTITAKMFLENFIQKCDENITPNVYANNKEYTYWITQTLCNILQDADIRYNCEYYRIDIYGWNPVLKTEVPVLNELTKNQNLGFHCWKPVIAIEHENNWAEWTDELVKLTYVRCPLKVIIAYNHNTDLTTHKRDDSKLLEVATKTLQHSAYYGEDKDDYLLIFGTSGQAIEYFKSNEANKYEYRGYLYNKEKEKFEEI